MAVKHPRHVVRGPRRAPGVAVPVKIAQQKLAVAVAVGTWQWLNDSGSGSGWVTVAVWQWMMGGSVAVDDGWQCGGVAGEKMEVIGPVLRELWVGVAKWRWLGGSGKVVVAVDQWAAVSACASNSQDNFKKKKKHTISISILIHT
jgi:hypothetical protein